MSSLAGDLTCVFVCEHKASVFFLLCLGLAQRAARTHSLKYEAEIPFNKALDKTGCSCIPKVYCANTMY